MKKYFFSFSLSFFCLMSGYPLLFSGEIEQVRRIQSHLIIQDPHSACEEARQALQLYPDSAALHESLIRSLAELGHEKEMLRAWETYVQKFPDKKENRELIEQMCWGVLNKSSTSTSLPIRIISLLAAYFSQDAKGVKILHQNMSDTSAIGRAISVRLASQMRDAKLINEIKRLFQSEKNWTVRKEVLKAIGQMKIRELQPQLTKLVSSDKSLAEEKMLAIKSLIQLLDILHEDEIAHLAQSNRAGLRLLACQAIAYFNSVRDQDWLFLLAKDTHSEVRANALQTLGLLSPRLQKTGEVIELARECLQDLDHYVALSAAWLLTLYSPEDGQKAFQRFLNHERREVRWLAAGALNATGDYGSPLACDILNRHTDSYVRLNLALGVIGQRLAVPQAIAIIDQTLANEKEKWMWLEQGIFRAVTPRTIQQGSTTTLSEADSTPEMDNQLVRLELLNTLAILRAPQAQESIRRFLVERTWGISGVASALLLMEGDEAAIELVQNLLQDSNPKVRIQSALILSLWGREESAIQVLEQHYALADREMKEKILEGLGRIGSMSSVPFLMEVLKEPSQTLRIIAATALIQCLNH